MLMGGRSSLHAIIVATITTWISLSAALKSGRKALCGAGRMARTDPSPFPFFTFLCLPPLVIHLYASHCERIMAFWTAGTSRHRLRLCMLSTCSAPSPNLHNTFHVVNMLPATWHAPLSNVTISTRILLGMACWRSLFSHL